jgi:3-hydroxybutyryl-CoA dehydrogenase
MPIQLVAIIGAGTMGCDLAATLPLYNYDVVLKDIDDEQLVNAERKVKTNLKAYKILDKNSMSHSISQLFSKISFVSDYSEFHKIDLVIENIDEIYEAKKQLYTELNEVCKNTVIYGVNTSCISITKIASLISFPENVIGMHFLNPIKLIKLVELIKGDYTSQNTIDLAIKFVQSLDKLHVLVNDFPGFVTNRILMLTINEATWVVQDKITEPREVDKIFKLGFGHKMGPLRTADLIGLDTVLNSLLVLYDSFGDPKFRPSPLLRKMVDAGLLGRKSGEGFFEYK